MIQTQVTIINKLGLHARAAAKFVACTSSFSSRIQMGKDNEMVDGKADITLVPKDSDGSILNDLLATEKAEG